MVYSFLDFTLDDRAFELRHKGEPVHLERRVLDLLLFLVSNRDRVVPKSELFEVLWDGRKVSEASLSVAVSAIRKACRKRDRTAKLIETQHARGYRFVAEVVERESPIERSAVGGSSRRFVGRGHELRVLLEALGRAERGEVQACLISGEPGIGKTRLAEEIATAASQRGMTVIRARCLEEDGAPPFYPWIQALRQCLKVIGDGSVLPEPVAAELGRLLPEVGSSALGRAEREADGSAARFRLFDSIAFVIGSLSRKSSVVLFIDDIHRADEASLHLLEFVLYQTQASRLLVLIADRDAETRRSDIHREVIGKVCRHAGASALRLSGLAPEEIELLLPDGLGADARSKRARALQEATGGNPFFLSQVMQLVDADDADLVGRLPQSVRDAVARQLEGLDQSAVEILGLASVIGRRFPARLLGAVAGNGAEVPRVLTLAQELRLIELVDSAEDSWCFSHALVRDVLYERLPADRRAKAHWENAIALEQAASTGGGQHLPDIAHHMYQGVAAGDPLAALAAVRSAGLQASDRLAFEEAAVQYKRAIELLQRCRPGDRELRCDLFTALGLEQARAGQRDDARQSLSVAADAARELCDGVRLAYVALASFPGFFAVEAGAPDRAAIELLREALRSLPEAQPGLRALSLGRLAMALAWEEEGRGREALSAEAMQLAEAVGDPALVIQSLLARWFAEWEPSRFDERWATADQLIETARLYGDRETLLLCRLFWVTCLLERGQVREFRRQVGVFEEAASTLRQPEAVWYAALLKAVLALHEGRLDEAESLSSRFAELGALVQDANVFHSRMSHRFLIAWERARHDELLAVATEGVERYPGVVGWRAARAWALAMSGDLAEAARAFELIARQGFVDIPRRMDWSLTMAFLSEVAVALGDRRNAAALLSLLEPVRNRLIVVGLCMVTWGSSSRLLGKLCSLLGRSEEAEILFREAIALEIQVGAPAWEAHSRVELAKQMRLSHGRSGDIALELQAAKAAADRLGLLMILDEISRI